jgi:N-acyl-D-aspartate/D-glutamate deacylase
MPTYFFDIRMMADTIRDLDGRFLPSPSAALDEAKRDALGLAADHLRFPQELPPAEAILIRDAQRRLLHVVTLKEVACEALDLGQNKRTSEKQSSGLAIVVAHQHDEWFAASTALNRRGYIVHSVCTLDDAVEKLKAMGAAHPLFRRKCPVIFASLDECEPSLNVLRAVRAACPTVWVFLVCNTQSRVIFLPRRSTPRQIEDLLFWPDM